MGTSLASKAHEMGHAGHSELGDFLRSRRERLDPVTLGFAAGLRRRTPGLRRGEVAELAGIGIDWYTRLEQGRAHSPSEATIDALASALRLNPAEHAHLRALVRHGGRRAFVRESVPDTLRRLVSGLNQPAYVTGLRWDVLAWNAAAVDIFTDFEALAESDRNVLLYMLTEPNARALFGLGWAEEAQRMVMQFRGTYDLYPEDPAFRDLLERLRQGSVEFETWWKTHDVRSNATGQKELHHPRKGLLRFEYATFQASDDPALKLAIYTLV